MSKGFGGVGHCVRCGDNQGPWSWFDGIGWLCDQCADEEDKKNENKEGDDKQ